MEEDKVKAERRERIKYHIQYNERGERHVGGRGNFFPLMLLIAVCVLQRQGEEDGAGGALHLPVGPPHSEYQGRALDPDHHSAETGTVSYIPSPIL